MKNVLTVVEREMRAYFVSPVAYVVLTIFVFLSGVFFQTILSQVVRFASLSAMQSQQFGGQPQPVDVPGLISQSFVGTLSVILLFMFPMMTMGLISEEKKRGTMELLLTLPLTDLQVVMGKFLAAVSFYVVMLLTTLVPMSILFIYGDPVWGPIATAYLGLLLYGVALLAVGLFVSTLTENQIIAGVLSFGVILLLWMVDVLAQNAVATTRDVLSYLSVLGHLDDFMKGVLATSHIIFYLSLMTLGLFLTYRSVDAMRWKG
jgi:gliding motility-associated transport system permease protein